MAVGLGQPKIQTGSSWYQQLQGTRQWEGEGWLCPNSKQIFVSEAARVVEGNVMEEKIIIKFLWLFFLMFLLYLSLRST